MSEAIGNPMLDAAAQNVVTTRCGVYWTACPEFWSRGIRYFNRPSAWKVWRAARVSHMGLVFERIAELDGCRATFRVTHEALYDSGWRREAWGRLTGFADRDPRNLVVLDWLPIDSATAARVHNSSAAWLGQRSYARWQLLGFAVAASILGRTLGLSLKNDQRKIVCSEGASFHLATGAKWDLRDSPADSFDGVSPESALIRHLQKSGKSFAALQQNWAHERTWRPAE